MKMRPYGTHDKSPKHVRAGGAPDGWFDVWLSGCRCCNGKYACKKRKEMKAFERRKNKVGNFGAIVQ